MQNPFRKITIRTPTYEEVKHYSSQTKEYVGLFGLNLRVQIRNTIEFIKAAFCYYGNLKFAQVDLFLLLTYLFHNPFTISKRFMQKKGEEDIYVYGETPLTSLDAIVKECHLSAQDRVYELGCGRGRCCFWLHSFIGCDVVGIEQIPEFVERANAIKARFNVQGVEFRKQNFLEIDYSRATVIYLYGTCLEENAIKQLIERFKNLPAGAKVITISYPLTEYEDNSRFEVMRRFQVDFNWGTADVYLQIKK